MKTPAGLLDNNFEWFVDESGEIKACYKGKILGFYQVPMDIILLFVREMFENIDFYKNHFNKNTTLMLFEYIRLHYSRLDHVADLEIATNKTNKEINPNTILTKRELEIAEALTESEPYKNIADRFNISLNTVRDHSKRIYAKLDIHCNRDLVRIMMDLAVIIIFS